MHPKGLFCGGNGKCGLWRECSVGGDIFSLRESRSAQQKGQPINDETNVLQDGTLIDLCGATLLWRSAEGLKHSPVSSFFLFFLVFFLMNFFLYRQNVIWKNWLMK